MGRYAEAERTIMVVKDAYGLENSENFESLLATYSLAQLYDAQGDSRKAIDMIKSIEASVHRQFGAGHSFLPSAQLSRAKSHQKLGEFDVANAILKELLDSQTVLWGADHRETLAVNSCGAALLPNQVRFESAAAKYRELDFVYRRDAEQNSLLSLLNRLHLAETDLDLNRLEEAQLAAEQVLNDMVNELGEDSLFTHSAMMVLGEIYHANDNYESAIEIFQRALAGMRECVSDDHPVALELMAILGIALVDSGQLDLAEPLLQESFDRSLATRGSNDPVTAITVEALSKYELAQNELSNAESHLRQTLSVFTKFREANHYLPLHTQAVLGRVLFLRGKYAEAEIELTHALDGQLLARGTDHSVVHSNIDDLAELMIAQKRFVDGEELLRKTLDVLDAKHSDKWEAYRSKSLLGAALLGQQEFDEAEFCLLEAIEGLEQRRTKIPYIERTVIRDAVEQTVLLYTNWDRKADAEKWRQVLQRLEHRQQL